MLLSINGNVINFVFGHSEKGIFLLRYDEKSVNYRATFPVFAKWIDAPEKNKSNAKSISMGFSLFACFDFVLNAQRSKIVETKD